MVAEEGFVDFIHLTEGLGGELREEDAATDDVLAVGSGSFEDFVEVRESERGLLGDGSAVDGMGFGAPRGLATDENEFAYDNGGGVRAKGGGTIGNLRNSRDSHTFLRMFFFERSCNRKAVGWGHFLVAKICHSFNMSGDMKRGFLLLAVVLFAGGALVYADIHQPPGAEYGPARKLGRALNNLALGPIDAVYAVSNVNYLEGNAAAVTYGAIKGVGRALARLGLGVYEFLLFPFPSNKGTYYPPYRLSVPWTLSGFEEFPPELGFETRYNYSRNYPMTPW